MLTERLAARTRAIAPPASMAMAQRARELARRGVDVVDFSTGEPDADTPAHIKEAAWKALRDGDTHYTPARGYPELLEAIAARLERTHRWHVEAQREVLVTPGGKQAILMTLLALLDPGDELLAPSPCWLSYADMAAITGARFVPVPSDERSGFVPSGEALEARVTPRTKAVLVNTPCNPTGVVWTHEQLERVAAVARRHHLLVISDETYDQIVFDGHAFISPGTLEGLRERTVVVNSFSKTYAMTGWRIGYLAGPAEVIDAASALHQQSATCVAGFVQRAAIAALAGPQARVAEMAREYQARRDLLIGGLGRIKGLRGAPVAGTFYALVDVRALGCSSREVSAWLLEEAHVATTPGVAYGDSAEGYVRLSFAIGQETIAEGLRRLAQAVGKRLGGETWQASSARTSNALQPR